MIKRKNDFATEIRENMRGGDGKVELCNFITPSELCDKGRLFGTIKLEPGCSIGYHIHENDSELFYILEGEGVYTDGEKQETLFSGDVAICPAGTGHSIKNNTDKALVFVALIVYA